MAKNRSNVFSATAVGFSIFPRLRSDHFSRLSLVFASEDFSIRRYMRRFLITVVSLSVCVLAVLGIAEAVSFAKQVIGIPREAYASDWTAVFVIEHIRTTGEWPTGWEDLRDEYDRLAVPQHYAWTFEELQSLINVDWDVSISDIQDSDEPLNHVRLTSGRQVSYGGDPDKLIYDYIQTGEEPNQIHQRIGEHAEKPKG